MRLVVNAFELLCAFCGYLSGYSQLDTIWSYSCDWMGMKSQTVTVLFHYIHKYIPLTLYPLRSSRGVLNIPPRRLRFTNDLALRNTADVTGGNSNGMNYKAETNGTSLWD
jgi:hypothetical protein